MIFIFVRFPHIVFENYETREEYLNRIREEYLKKIRDQSFKLRAMEQRPHQFYRQKKLLFASGINGETSLNDILPEAKIVFLSKAKELLEIQLCLNK